MRANKPNLLDMLFVMTRTSTAICILGKELGALFMKSKSMTKETNVFHSFRCPWKTLTANDTDRRDSIP